MGQMAYAGIASGCCLAAVYWYLPISSSFPEVDTAPVRLVGGHIPASPLTASGYVVAQRQASVASKGTGRLEYISASQSEAALRRETSSREYNKTMSRPFNTRLAHV